MKDGLSGLLTFLCVIVFFIFFAYVLVEGAKADARYQHELFSIWQKVNPTTPLTFDEWQKLKYNDLLGR